MATSDEPDGGDGSPAEAAPPLPEALEARLYAACFDSDDADAAVAALLRAEPLHAASLQRLAAALRGVQRELRVLDDDPGNSAPDQTLGPGARLGQCLIETEIGRGAFGVVYRAWQLAPVRRPVAIKVLTWHRGTPEVMSRFASERDLLARLDHPGVTRVFDAGVTGDGQPYFVMELVAGATLIDFATTERLSLARRLRLFVQLCEVVQHAHQIGVVHRDLKPGNVLVRRRDQTFEVKVIDFGLAKVTAAELSSTGSSTTEIGRLLGTPEYMSPEQARGQPVDTRTDVHALGVLLFQLLTGSLPFASETLRADGVASVVAVLQHQEAPLPSQVVTARGAAACGTTPAKLRAALRGDLDLVVSTCLQKERDHRYSTVAALAADVVRHLEHQPLSVRPPRLRYVLGKLLSRHRLAGTALLSAAASLLVAATALAWSFVRVDGARSLAEENAYAATIVAARAALDGDRAAAARDLLRETDPRRRGLEYGLLHAALEDALQVVATGVSYVGGFEIVDDTALLLDRDRPALVAVPLGRSGEVVRTELSREPRALAVDPTCSMLAIVETGGRILLGDARTRVMARSLPLPAEAGDLVAFTGDGERLLVSGGRELWIIDVATGELRHRCRHRDNLWDLAVDPRRQRIAVSDHSGDVRLWDPVDGVELDALVTPEVPQRICFHPRKDVLFVADDRSTLRSFDLRLGGAIAAQLVSGAHAFDIECSLDGSTLLSCHGDGSVRAWSPDNMLELGVYRGHAGRVLRARARADGGWCTVGADRTLREWSPDLPQRALPLPAVYGTPTRGMLAAGRDVLYVATLGGTVGAMDLVSRKLLWSSPTGRPRCHGVALVDDDRLWVSSGERLLALDAADGRVVGDSEPRPGRQLRDLRTRADGRELVVAADDGSLARCSVADGKTIAIVGPSPTAAGDVYELALHGDDRMASIVGPVIGAACADLTDGTWRWHRSEPCVSLAADPYRGALLLLLVDGRLLEVEETTGELRRVLWRGDGGGSGVGLWGDGSRIVVNDSRTHILLRSSGRDLLALPGGRFSPSSLCIDATRDILVCGGGHFFEPAELRRWPLHPVR